MSEKDSKEVTVEAVSHVIEGVVDAQGNKLFTPEYDENHYYTEETFKKHVQWATAQLSLPKEAKDIIDDIIVDVIRLKNMEIGKEDIQFMGALYLALSGIHNVDVRLQMYKKQYLRAIAEAREHFPDLYKDYVEWEMSKLMDSVRDKD